jgi:hypothetical protein
MSADAMVNQSISSPDSKSDAPTRLHGRRLLLARLVWFVVVAFTVVLFVLTIPLQVAEAQRICTSPVVNDCFNLGQLTPQLVQELEQMGLSLGFYAGYVTIVQVAFPLLFLAVGALIFWFKSDDWMALLVSLMLVVFGLADSANTSRLLPLAYPSLTFPILLLQFLGVGLLMFFIFLFPDGRLVPRWILWLMPFILIREAINTFLPDSGLVNSAPWFVLQLAEVGLVLYAQIYRYRRISGAVQRQQTKWVVYGLAMAFIGYFGFILLFVIGFTTWTTNVLAVLFLETLLPFFTLLIPLSILIAVLRFRLYEIDLLINRTLVYVPLTAILAGIFAASISLSQKMFIALTGQSSDAATVLTTLIVVAAVDPLKIGLQHLVDRRFKETPDPTKTLKAFDRQVLSFIQMVDREAITRRLLDEASHAFEAKNGALFLARDGKLELVQTCGDWSGEAKVDVPLQNPESGARIGLVALGSRRNGLDYSPRDRETLQQIAMHVTRVIALMGYRDGVRH